MPRTISVSGLPKRLFRYAVAGFVVFLFLLFGGQALYGVFETAGMPLPYPDGPVGLALFAVLWTGLTLLWVWRIRGWEGSSSMWAPVPEEQYLGRFAEAGGLARYDREKAIDRLPDGDDESD